MIYDGAGGVLPPLMFHNGHCETMVRAATSAKFRFMMAIQAGLFLAALVIVAVDPNAERSYFGGAGDPRSCDVSFIVETPDTQVEQQDGLQTILPELAVVATMPAVEAQLIMLQPASPALQDRSFRPHFVISIWCSSDL